MQARSIAARRRVDLAVKIASGLAALLGCLVLALILYEIVARGVQALNWNVLTLPTMPSGEPGGVANAIVGTFVITVLATVLGVPLGMLAGVFLAEFGKGTRIARLIHFCANVMMGVPSIIVGIFVYALLVVPRPAWGYPGGYSGYAGAVALAIIMLPVVTRTTEDMLGLVPPALREAALALGAPRWKVIFSVLFRAAKTGLLTGVLLAVARVSGETAPLLFTALNNYALWPTSPGRLAQPTANLTITINNYAGSPADDWIACAWAAALLITVSVLGLTICSRLALWLRSR